MPIILRQLSRDSRVDDITIYADMMSQLYVDLEPHMPAEFAEESEDPNDFELTLKALDDKTRECYLIYEGIKPVGLVELYRWSREKVTVSYLYVDKLHRNKGTAGIVLEQVFARLKKAKVKVVDLTVLTQNRTAYKLYKKYGFKSYASSMYKPL